MKIFGIFGITGLMAKSLDKPSKLASLPVMDPEDPLYSQKTVMLLGMIGVDVEKDPYFAEDGEAPLSTLRSQDGNLDLRKLKQLKILVASQMSDDLRKRAGVTGTGFGLYCYYGCHCLTDDDHIDPSKGLVGGQIIDDIDNTCHQMGVCYKCLREKYTDPNTGNTTCKAEETKYNFSFHEDGTIDCSKNKEGCKLDACLCDKDFAENVSLYEDQWHESKHITRGNFDREGTCPKPSAKMGSKRDTCCGLRNFPYVGYKKEDEDKCCEKNPLIYPKGYQRHHG